MGNLRNISLLKILLLESVLGMIINAFSSVQNPSDYSNRPI